MIFGSKGGGLVDWLKEAMEWKGTRLQDSSLQLTKELLCKVIKRNVSVKKIIIHLLLPTHPQSNLSRVINMTILLKFSSFHF